MNLIAPPLKIWLIVFSLGLLFSFGFYTYSSSQYGIQYKTTIEIEKLIQNNLSSNKDTISIIIVGTSLTRNAFGDDFDISKAISQQLRVPIKALKINIYSLTMEKASDLYIFESINKYPPDILFIESRLFIDFIKNPKRIPTHISYSINYLMSKLKYIFGKSKNGNTINHLLNPSFSFEYFNLKTNRDNLNLILKRERRVMSMKENNSINKTFDLLNKQKKKVILLGFPNSNIVNKVFDKTESEFVKLTREYQNQYNIAYWSIKCILFKDSLFTDGSHLNYQGAKVYQNWFLKKIKSDL